jgi:hypothetical protein
MDTVAIVCIADDLGPRDQPAWRTARETLKSELEDVDAFI